MPLNQGQVGVQQNTDSTNPLTIRMGKQGDQIVSELHGRYYEQTYRGNVFFVANQAVVTTTVGLATTYTGLCLSNPIGSGKHLVLLKATMFQSVIQATQPEAFGIATGFHASTNVTHTTPVAPRSGLVGAGTTPVALADVSATLPAAPFYDTFVTNTASATVLSTTGIIDFEGSRILIPGAFACWVTPAQASVNGMWFSFSWEEVAL